MSYAMLPHVPQAFYIYNNNNNSNDIVSNAANNDNNNNDNPSINIVQPSFTDNAWKHNNSITNIQMPQSQHIQQLHQQRQFYTNTPVMEQSTNSTPLIQSVANERLNNNQRYFSYPSPRNYKQFSPQNFSNPTSVFLSNTNGGNNSGNNSGNNTANNSNCNSTQNSFSNGSGNNNNNYNYNSYELSKRQSSHQIIQYPSSPIQFAQTQTPPCQKPSSFGNASQCIQPSQLIQPIYLTPSATPLSTISANGNMVNGSLSVSPNSFLGPTQTQMQSNMNNQQNIGGPCTPSTPQPTNSTQEPQLRYPIPSYSNQQLNNYAIHPQQIQQIQHMQQLQQIQQYQQQQSMNLHHSHSKNITSPINGTNSHTQISRKRKRRKYCEIKRIYKCTFKECDKSYGTLNHLNFHIQLQKHGAKRLASEFKSLRNLEKDA